MTRPRLRSESPRAKARGFSLASGLRFIPTLKGGVFQNANNRHLFAKTCALPQGGFTIVEVLVAMAIGLPLILILYQMGVTSAQAITTIQGLGQAELALNSATDSFMRDVRQAQAKDLTCRKDPSITEDLSSEGESPNGQATLLLRTPAIIGGQQSMTRFDYIIYKFTESGSSPNQLKRIVKRDRLSSQPESERVVARNVTLVKFSFPTAGEVRLEIRVAVPQDRFSFTQITNCRAAWRN